MMIPKPFIYLFKTIGGYYIYDVNTNQIVKIEKSVYNYLFEEQKGNIPSHSDDVMIAIENLKKEGLLKSNKVETIHNQDTDIIEDILNNKISQMVLQITQGCNLRCKYCVYSGNYENREHSQKKMKLELAIRAIDFFLEHSSSANFIILGFYGGEPLLEFDLIIQCMDYIIKKAEGKKVIFSMTVNGTLLSIDKVAILSKYNCSLVISLDGPKELHDKNRVFADNRGTFDTIIENLKKVKDKFPDFYKKIKFNMVLDSHYDLRCLNNFITDSEIFDALSFRINSVSDLYEKSEPKEAHEGSIIFREYELFKIYLKKIGKLKSIQTSSLYESEYITIKNRMVDWHEKRKELPNIAHPGGPCTPGKKRIFINVDGDFYPCERVSENSEVMKIGNIETGFDILKIKNLINIGKLTDEHCRNCWAFTYCLQCAAYADGLTEFSYQNRITHCEKTKSFVDNMFKDYCTLREFGHNFDYDASLIFKN